MTFLIKFIMECPNPTVLRAIGGIASMGCKVRINALADLQWLLDRPREGFVGNLSRFFMLEKNKHETEEQLKLLCRLSPQLRANVAGQVRI